MQYLIDEIIDTGTYSSSQALLPKAQGTCSCPKCQQKRELNSPSGTRILDEILYGQSGGHEYEFEEIASDFKIFNTPRPGAFYKIQYKKGGLLETTSRAYGVGYGSIRLEYAKLINNHPRNRKFWVKPYNSFTRKHFPRGIISFRPIFTCFENQLVAKKGEKKCFANIWIPFHSNLKQPDSPSCGVPFKSKLNRSKNELEDLLFERASRLRIVKPRLSFFQEALNSQERNHFHCQASRLAKKISAMTISAKPSNCNLRVGPTPYATGADIIKEIKRANRCGGKKLEMIHIFGHGHQTRISGNFLVDGLFSSKESNSILSEGRKITAIPTSTLSDNVVIVIHNCNCARGGNNIAKELFQHLASALNNPKVFGHFNSGCAGRNNSWKEYSKKHPSGRLLKRLNTISPAYSENGCC
ncbi:MAG: hypothetical protein J5I98_09205 [Phaeodactylibacter sp.]|nr:hypothetical protein [Phaeodactylibacter sp.]